MENSEVISVLSTLTDTCKDGELGFRSAADRVGSQELKTLFLSIANRCTSGLGELQVLIQHLGGQPDARGSASETLHRGWAGLKSMVGHIDDHAILTECERGEDVAKARYREALAANLPPNVRVIVDRQSQDVIANHERIRNLRDAVAHL
jgi:uncharacterized protein (TIGR02284 family)